MRIIIYRGWKLRNCDDDLMIHANKNIVKERKFRFCPYRL